ncbi:hypothetical protein [Chryseobacterium sp.]|uniref:hypothetical protein n=1 Tax=Chryseobacterium sp. TaxID=1871047 RepID=UPI0011C8FB62|nr:hypothetical protein [Chryseobacterium sp.]TXF79046.1 hypothetical protein FUA25_01250 [Chryseobacterium sp.]
MKQLGELLMIVCFLFAGIINAQSTKHLRYFNQDNIKISKSEFQTKRDSGEFLEIPGDSLNSLKLVFREEEGSITDIEDLYEKLASASEVEINKTKPLVIIFHPGEDRCNSSGSTDIKSSKKWYAELDQGVFKIIGTNPIYIYKNKSGLLKDKSFLPWNLDPDGTVERLFFKNHYPCGSFTVISPNGTYISYFGEFPKEYVWAASRLKSK